MSPDHTVKSVFRASAHTFFLVFFPFHFSYYYVSISQLQKQPTKRKEKKRKKQKGEKQNMAVQITPSRMGAGGRHRWIHAEEFPRQREMGRDDSMGEIPKRWPMRRPMLEVVSTVVSLKPPRVSMAREIKEMLQPDTQHRVQINFAPLPRAERSAADRMVACI